MAGIFWTIQSRYHNKPLHLPATITLVSRPVTEKTTSILSTAPQRVQTASPSQPKSPPAVSQSTEPTATTNPLTSQANLVPSSTAAREEPQPPPGQLSGASGGFAEGTSQGNTVIRIGSAQALDNVDYSPLYNPKPAYPPIALKAGIQGSVDVDLVINEFGRVEEFSIIKVNGHPSFRDETAKVVGKWRFPPPRVDGKKVKIKFLYTVNFKLD